MHYDVKIQIAYLFFSLFKVYNAKLFTFTKATRRSDAHCRAFNFGNLQIKLRGAFTIINQQRQTLKNSFCKFSRCFSALFLPVFLKHQQTDENLVLRDSQTSIFQLVR